MWLYANPVQHPRVVFMQYPVQLAFHGHDAQRLWPRFAHPFAHPLLIPTNAKSGRTEQGVRV